MHTPAKVIHERLAVALLMISNDTLMDIIFELYNTNIVTDQFVLYSDDSIMLRWGVMADLCGATLMPLIQTMVREKEPLISYTCGLSRDHYSQDDVADILSRYIENSGDISILAYLKRFNVQMYHAVAVREDL